MDCFCTAAYSVGHVINPQTFPMAHPRDLFPYPEDVRKAFRKSHTGDPFEVLLDQVLTAPEYEQLKVFRNALSHRGTPPRLHQLRTNQALPSLIPSNFKDLAARWKYDMPPVSLLALEQWTRDKIIQPSDAEFCERRQARTSVQLQSTNAQTPGKNEEHQRPESKTNQQDRAPSEICKTSISGSNPDGASIFSLQIERFPDSFVAHRACNCSRMFSNSVVGGQRRRRKPHNSLRLP